MWVGMCTCRPYLGYCWPKRSVAAPLKRSEAHAHVETTRLRLATPHWVVFTRRGERRIQNLNVEVANVRTIIAREVEVYTRFGTGEAFRLAGPRSLGGGQKATYVLRGKPTIVSMGTPAVVAQCSNCER